MLAVARSELDKREKAALNAMIPYIDWGLEETSCYPSMQKLVQASGYSERSLQSAMSDLERRGILRVSEGPPGWKTFTRTLSWPALNAATPAAIAGVKHTDPRRHCGVGAPDHRSHCGNPAQPLRGTPAAIAPHPRKPRTQSFHRPSIEQPTEQQEGADATDGMDGQYSEATRKRLALSALKAKGVKGKNLDRLAACPQLTPKLIEHEWARLTAASEVRNAPAALVRVLEDHAGIKLSSLQALAGMDPNEKRALIECQSRIEQRRRDAQLAAP